MFLNPQIERAAGGAGVQNGPQALQMLVQTSEPRVMASTLTSAETKTLLEY